MNEWTLGIMGTLMNREIYVCVTCRMTRAFSIDRSSDGSPSPFQISCSLSEHRKWRKSNSANKRTWLLKPQPIRRAKNGVKHYHKSFQSQMLCVYWLGDAFFCVFYTCDSTSVMIFTMLTHETVCYSVVLSCSSSRRGCCAAGLQEPQADTWWKQQIVELS